MQHIRSSAHRRRPTKRRALATLFGAAAMLVGLSSSGSAMALPKVGDARASTKLVDGWDRQLDLAKVERPLLLIYEDEGSSKQNQALKDDLTKLEESKHYRKGVVHVVVADVSSYDYWPAKDIAKGELQKWSHKLGLTIYGDFSGQAKKRLALDAGQSNVVLYASDGRVLFAHSGSLDDKQRAAVLRILRAQAHIDAPARPSGATTPSAHPVRERALPELALPESALPELALPEETLPSQKGAPAATNASPFVTPTERDRRRAELRRVVV